MMKDHLESAIVALGDVGNRLDDSLDAARLDQARYEGAKLALIEARRKVEEHLAVYVKKDSEEGVISISEHGLVSKYLIHCVGILENLTVAAEVQSQQGIGKIMGLETAVRQTKHAFDVNKGKYDLVCQMEARGGQKERPEDTQNQDGHPGNPIADRREESPPSQGKRKAKKV